MAEDRLTGQASTPGLCRRLGMRLRAAWLRCRLKSAGSPLWVQCGAQFMQPDSIEVGDRCTFESFVVVSSSRAGSGIRIGSNVHIRYGTVLYTGDLPSGGIEIGDSTLINYHCSFLGDAGIRIGKNVLISPGVVVTSFQHGFRDRKRLIVEQEPELKAVTIEDDVYLGANAVILPGVTIKRGAVIGAGAVVTKDVPEYSIAVGVPAEVKGTRV